MRHLDLISDDDAFLLVFIRIFIALMSNEKKKRFDFRCFSLFIGTDKNVKSTDKREIAD